MDIFQTITLGVVEGLTEFLPVSSTGHMIITSSLMGIASDPFVKTFTVAIQLGAILSVMLLYFKRFVQSFDFYVKLLIAFIPAAIMGFLLSKYIDKWLGDPVIVAVSLFLGGIVLLFVDNWFKNEASGKKEVDHPSAFKIGLFQCLALLPGVSRSAATIIGGLSQKLTRKTAAEFSFFLAVPTMFAATAYKLFKTWKESGAFTHDQVHTLILGNAVAFLVAIFAIRGFISFLTKRGFKIFGWYRILLGAALLIIHIFIHPLTSL